MKNRTVILKDGTPVDLIELGGLENYSLRLEYKEHLFSPDLTEQMIMEIFPELELFKKKTRKPNDLLFRLLNSVICNCYYLNTCNLNIEESKDKGRIRLAINRSNKHIHKVYSKMNISRRWVKEVYDYALAKQKNGFQGEFCGEYSCKLDLSIIKEPIRIFLDKDVINITSDIDPQLQRINNFYYEFFNNNNISSINSIIERSYYNSANFFCLSRSKNDDAGEERAYSEFIRHKKIRNSVKVNGKPLVSIDMKSAFAYMAAASNDVQLSGDFYNIEGIERKLSKKIFNYMMNSKVITAHNIMNSEDIKELGPTKEDVQRCIDYFNNIEWFTSSEFYKNKQSFHILAKKEADVTISTVEKMTNNNIPAFPVHDAIYCLPEHAELVKKEVEERYNHIFNNKNIELEITSHN